MMSAETSEMVLSVLRVVQTLLTGMSTSLQMRTRSVSRVMPIVLAGATVQPTL